MKKIIWTTAILLACTAMAPGDSFAFAKKKKKSAADASKTAPADAKKVTIASKTKSAVKFEGLMTIYQDTTDGKTFLLLKKDQIGKEFIYWSYSENGLARVGLFRGSFRDNAVFRVSRYFDRIDFEMMNTNFYFDPNNAISKSAEANVSPALLLSEKVIAEDEKEGLILIDASSLLMDEKLDRVKPPQFPGASPGQFNLGNLSKSKSKYHSIKSYPSNTDVVVDLVYDNPSAINGGGKDVTDPRAVTVRLQHSFIAMPDNAFKTRRDDPRVGYFGREVDDMTSAAPTPYKDVINRWHLVKKDPNAALSEPVEPITWWVENTTPMEFRETIVAAGLKWNEAFEKAGFKNAVVMKIQPDTADWDAGDIRYNVLRWTSSPYPPFGGYGPSFTNPYTGQILGADIMLEYVFVTNRLRQADLFNNSGLVSHDELDHSTTGQSCMLASHLQHNFQLGNQVLEATGASAARKKAYLDESLYYLVMHEMGHTMGLNHNMKASQLHAPKDLHNKTITEAVGLVGSVMDYPAVNLALDTSKQGNYFTTRTGPYDLWAIEYGYSTALADADAEEARLSKILSRSTEPALIFGNDADDMRAPGKAIDPRVNVNDMSSDAIAYSEDRFQLVNKLLIDVKKNYTKDGQSYQEMLNAYMILGGEMSSASATVSRYIGGVYVERGFIGQENAKQPFTPVSKADQKRAMNSLNKYIFAPNAFDAASNLYSHLQVQRRGFNFFAASEDPKIHKRVLTIQLGVLAHLLHPATLQRITDSKLYGNQYGLAEMMTDLTNGIFQVDAVGNVNSFRQNLQQEYVERLIMVAGLVKDKSSGHDNIAQSVALANLTRLNTQLKAAASGDAESKAHRESLRYKIELALKG